MSTNGVPTLRQIIAAAANQEFFIQRPTWLNCQAADVLAVLGAGRGLGFDDRSRLELQLAEFLNGIYRRGFSDGQARLALEIRGVLPDKK